MPHPSRAARDAARRAAKIEERRLARVARKIEERRVVRSAGKREERRLARVARKIEERRLARVARKIEERRVVRSAGKREERRLARVARKREERRLARLGGGGAMLIEGMRPRPGDRRGFVHKRLLSGIGGFISGGPLGAAKGFLLPPKSRAAQARERSLDIPLPTLPGRIPGLLPECDPPLVRGPTGLCIAPTSPLGASRLFGEAVMGQYGAALVPGSQIVDRATCPRGTQLGNDGLCYNKSQITNKQRMWPAGRKPLLTGGDMRAISTAARAGRRMELATKRLQKMGMMKKPTRRGGTPAGHRARLVHTSDH